MAPPSETDPDSRGLASTQTTVTVTPFSASSEKRANISTRIRSSTYAVGNSIGSTVGYSIGNTLKMAVPQLSGAIDIMVVRQPDGTLKSSPFHVRFGKYEGLVSSRNRLVDIYVNDELADFHMTLKATGEAYFEIPIDDDEEEEDDGTFYGDLGSMVSPPASGYTSEDELSLQASQALGGSSSSSEVQRWQSPQSWDRYYGGAVEARKQPEFRPGPKPKSGRPTKMNMMAVGFGRSPMYASKSGRAKKLPEPSLAVGDALDEADCTLEAAAEYQAATGSEVSATVDVMVTMEPPGGEGAAGGLCTAAAAPLEGVGYSQEPRPPPVVLLLTPSGDPGKPIRVSIAASATRENSLQNSLCVSDDGDVFLDAVSRGSFDFGPSLLDESEGGSTRSCPVSTSEGYLAGLGLPYLRASGSKEDLASLEAGLSCHQGHEELELSMCGHLFTRDMPADEAERIFDAHRVGAEAFRAGGAAMVESDALVLRLGGYLYPWKAAAPMILGRLAFGGTSWGTLVRSGAAIPGTQVDAEVPPKPITGTSPPVGGSWRLWPFGSWSGSPKLEEEGAPSSSGRPEPLAKPQRTRRSLVPTAEQLEGLNLKPGENVIEFVLHSHLFADHRLRAYVYVLPWNSFIVISDVDGTITRSDVLGHLLPHMGLDWSHAGVARLLSNIGRNGYYVMYLSSRAIAQASHTRDYLHTLSQDGILMPKGPVLISPDGLIPSLYREMVVRRPHEFKIATLQGIRDLFPETWNPFYSGFGNRNTDEVSYKAVGIPPGRIFTINPKGEIRRSGGNAVGALLASLDGINSLVDGVFPPLDARHEEVIRTEYTDASYWKPSYGQELIGSDEEQDGTLYGSSPPNLRGH